MASVNNFGYQLREVFEKFTFPQKVSLVAAIAGLLIVFVVLMNWVSQPTFNVLFSALNEKDAGRIVEQLQSGKIPYKLEAGGTTILVPENLVYEQRMKFANMGLPMEGIVGYEVFDQTKLGMTDFLQKMNYHRALEGELSRTLMSINEILSARVHIVIPKPALFEEDKKPATASVALRLRGDGLNLGQVQGIANLVAASVEGLTPENISIIDSRGNILSGDFSGERFISLSGSQYELKRKVEEYLENKVQSMLVGSLGPNKSIIRVSAELDFDRIEKTEQTFDPTSQVVRSEEVSTRTGTASSQGTPSPGGTNTSNKQDEEEAVITNYEISNKLEHMVQAVGNIGRLSIAVMVDGNYKIEKNEAGNQVRTYMERSPEEVAKITSLVKNAIGFNDKRGDQITVTSMPFDVSQEPEHVEDFTDVARYELYREILQKGLMVAIILAMLLTVRALVKRSRKLEDFIEPVRAKITTTPIVDEVREAELFAEEETERVRKKIREEIGRKEKNKIFDSVEKQEIMKKINNFAVSKSVEASNLIKSWLHDKEEY